MKTLYAGAEKGLSIQRDKCLGEMNAEQSGETTMDTQKRCQLRLKIQDNVGADNNVTMLMGDRVEPAASSSKPRRSKSLPDPTSAPVAVNRD